MNRAGLVVLGCLVACDRRPHVTTCADDLAGVWDGPSGAWMLLDNRDTLEGYPLFADLSPTTGANVMSAPRVLDLDRTPQTVVGGFTRRYMWFSHACYAKAAVHVLTCADDTLELVLGDPGEPAFDDSGDCRPMRPAPSRRERWRRR